MIKFRQGFSVFILALGAMLAAGSRPALALNKISNGDFGALGPWTSGPSGVGQDGLCDLANSTTGNNPFDGSLFTTGTGNPAPDWKFTNSQASRAELGYIYQQISIPGTGFTKLKGKFQYNGDSITGTSVQYFRLDIFDVANGSIAKPKAVLACEGSITLTAGTTTGWVSVPFGSDYSAATSGSTVYTIRVTGGAQNNAAAGVQGTLQFDNVVVNVAPTGLTCAAVAGSTSVSLNWAASTAGTGASGLRWYRVYRATAPGVTIASSLVATPGIVGNTDSGTIGNTRYYYAIGDQDQNLEDSPLSQEVSQLTYPGVPSTPTYSAVGDTSLTVVWSGAPGGAPGYKIERSTDNVAFFQVGTSVTNTFNDTLLTQNTVYYYRVIASNVTGDSLPSVSSSVNTLASTSTPTRTNTPNATQTFLAAQTQTVLALSFTATQTPTYTSTPTATDTGTDTPTPSPTPCVPVVRPVCTVCTYNTIAAAMAAASPCDIIRLDEDIDEAVSALGNVAEITGINPDIVWSTSSSLSTLQITAAFNQTCLIHDLILDHGGPNGDTVTLQGLSPNVKLFFQHCVLRNTGAATGYAVVGSSGNASGTDTLVFLQCKLAGKADQNGLALTGYTQPGSIRMENCLVKDFSGSGSALKLANTTNQVLNLHNNTLHNNGTALDWACRADISNNLFTSNGADLVPSGSADNADVSYCGFATQPSLAGSGPGNIFGLSDADYVAVGSDFHLAPGSAAIDAGATLPGVTLDILDQSRPQGSAYDIGAYESVPVPTDTPTDTPSDTPTPTASDTATNTATDSPTNTYTSSNTPTNTPTQTPTVTNTFTASNTPSNTPTHTPTVTNTFTASNTPSDTPTHTPTITNTFTASNTPSDTPTHTPTITNTFTSSNTPSNTATHTPTVTDTFTSSNTPSNTPTHTPTVTDTFTSSNTPTSTSSDTPTFTQTPTITLTPTDTPTDTFTATHTFTSSLTPTSTFSDTFTPSFTPTKTPTPSFSSTPTFTPSDTHTPDATLTVAAVATQTSVALSWTPTPTPSTAENGYLSANVFRPLKGQSLDISFRSPQDDRVRVKVFNLAGELVRDLGETDVQAGVFQTLPWNGRNADGEMAASQVYLVSLTGRHMKVLKKVILLK